MQTFLPHADFARSMQVLDRARLGKQRVEAKQIMLALTTDSYGWKSHPVTKMWSGCPGALALYGAICCREWCSRGYKDSLLPWFLEQMELHKRHTMPFWLGYERLHAAHRSNLLRKDLLHYAQFGWSEPTDLPYIYPTSLEELVNHGRSSRKQGESLHRHVSV
jgi:hypothetical protein